MKRILAILFCLTIAALTPARADQPATRSFGVINQRSIQLTAEYWNPILKYVSKKSGVLLELKMGKSAPDTSAMTGRGEFDYVYSNHIFTPTNSKAGYLIFARPVEEAIQGQIVVAENTPVNDLKELQGKEIGFPSATAFVGYAVPMDALSRAGVQVVPVFGGNQEGIMAQLKVGKVIAAGVNSEVMREYSKRENFKYRILWTSENYLSMPISAHPRIAKTEMDAVRKAFADMSHESEGVAILQASAAVIKQKPPYGFVSAKESEYNTYRDYYKKTLVKDIQ
jgi:phosphonate transport system substrate-binding protein